MRRFICTATIVFVLLGATTDAGAQNQGDYDLTGAVAAGGGQASGGAYTLEGSLGQSGARTLRGGDYALGGGLFGGGDQASALGRGLFLPLVRR